MVTKIKLAVLIFLALLIIVFVLQNTATMAIRFLFWEFSSSVATLVILMFALGFCVGLLVAGWLVKGMTKGHSSKTTGA
ncbi:LapA family protein [Thermogutta sp.]|uniref:LapA family protein n=1 Tax=Thermogutta sp. TaxID=1962930 RepID=UPI00321FD6DE